MNILYVIGNGFDLKLKMETSFKNFLSSYKKIKSTNETIQKLKKNISNDVETWCDLEIRLGDYTQYLKSEEEFDIINLNIRENLSNYLKEQEKLFDISKIDKNKLLNNLSYPEDSLLPTDKKKLIEFKTNGNLSNGTLEYLH